MSSGGFVGQIKLCDKTKHNQFSFAEKLNPQRKRKRKAWKH